MPLFAMGVDQYHSFSWIPVPVRIEEIYIRYINAPEALNMNYAIIEGGALLLGHGLYGIA